MSEDKDAVAAYLLALLILSGVCDIKDQTIARNYLEMSAKQGNQSAAKLLGNDDLFTGPAILNFWEDYLISEQTED